MNVAAVIVTFNRSDKLENSIRSIYAGQTVPQWLFVINNCATDGTGDLLKRLVQEFTSLRVLETHENLGGAGGFFVGLKAAYDQGASHFWLMDDDAYAQPESLSRLIASYEALMEREKVGFLCSRVDWTGGGICEMNQPETTWDWMRDYSAILPVVKVSACSFVSCFFSREILEEVGLPIKEFFIWFDDHEFTHRISKQFPCHAVLNSVVEHDLPTNEAADYGKINDDNVWKFRYGAANESWFRLRKQSIFHWLLFWAQKNWDMHHGRVSLKNRISINLATFRGLFTRHKIQKVKDVDLEDCIAS